MSSRLNWKNSNLLSTLKQWLRVLQSLRYSEPSTSTPLSCGDPSTMKPADDLASTKYASLRELPLKVFIENYCYGAQLPNWEKLLSEYYIIRQDKQASEFVRLVYGMEQIRYRAMSIDLLVATLREGYHKDVADALRAYFPRFKFTEDSYLQEIEYAVNIERITKPYSTRLRCGPKQPCKCTTSSQRPRRNWLSTRSPRRVPDATVGPSMSLRGT